MVFISIRHFGPGVISPKCAGFCVVVSFLSDHTRAREQRANVRRLLHNGGGKQKEAARAAAILRSNHGSNPPVSCAFGGFERENGRHR